jgi:hypothetical protein
MDSLIGISQLAEAFLDTLQQGTSDAFVPLGNNYTHIEIIEVRQRSLGIGVMKFG